MSAGTRKHRHSLFAALLTGVLLAETGWFGWDRWPLGLLLGFFYSNAFEYFCHRFLLHSGASYFRRRHQLHHESWGRADEPLYVNIGTPPAILALFTVNSLPIALLDRFGAGIGGGVLIGFVAYYLLYEESHWRIHLGGLPRRLEWMRRHHFAHHKGFPGRYNILLPLFDKFLSGTLQRR